MVVAASTGTQDSLGPRILQLHPTLKCNLLCKHCYSESGPLAQSELDMELLRSVISDASAMGYEAVAVSGGEPLLFKGLEELLRHAKSCGMETLVTTNGTLLDFERCSSLRSRLDLLAISLDGPPELHNEIRNEEHAFDRMTAGLESVRDAGLTFGFIHTLTRRSWEHLLWLAEFASKNGASLLHLHPLELTGRANSLMPLDSLDDDVLSRVYLLALALASKYEGSMRVQLDVVDRESLSRYPESVYGTEWTAELTDREPADLLRNLVIEADGSAVRISYGISRKYRICNLHDQRLVEAWPSYLEHRYPLLRRLCRELFEEIVRDEGPVLLNWYEFLVARSWAQQPDMRE